MGWVWFIQPCRDQRDQAGTWQGGHLGRLLKPPSRGLVFGRMKGSRGNNCQLTSKLPIIIKRASGWGSSDTGAKTVQLRGTFTGGTHLPFGHGSARPWRHAGVRALHDGSRPGSSARARGATRSRLFGPRKHRVAGLRPASQHDEAWHFWRGNRLQSGTQVSLGV